MNKPQMIIFDYGQTLVDEMNFDGVKGTEAVIDKCLKNTNHITAEEIQQLANEINSETGRFNPETRHLCLTEIHNHLPLGMGDLDLPYYFNLAEQHDCRVVLETKTLAGLRQSVEWIKERF